MKLVGFISEHDSITGAKSFSECLTDQKSSLPISDKIANYLERGVFIFGWMHYVSDILTNEIIAPHAYYTDGKWVWPSYLSHYLQKHKDFGLDIEFVKHVYATGFIEKNDPRVDVAYFESALAEVFRGANPEKFENITGIGKF